MQGFLEKNIVYACITSIFLHLTTRNNGKVMAKLRQSQTHSLSILDYAYFNIYIISIYTIV